MFFWSCSFRHVLIVHIIQFYINFFCAICWAPMKALGFHKHTPEGITYFPGRCLRPYRKSEKMLENCGFGVQGLWEVIFIVNILKRVAQKLRIIILLHFGLQLLRFILGKPEKSSFSSLWEVADVTMTRKTNYSYFGRHQMAPNNSRNFPSHFRKYQFGKYQAWESVIFDNY